MYGLKPEIDFSFLRERELIQLAVGRYQVIFAFDKEIAISVEGSYEFHSETEKIVWTPGETSAAAAALGLLGKSVTDVSAVEGGTLKITFLGGETLSVADSNRSHESYQVTGPGIMIVV